MSESWLCGSGIISVSGRRDMIVGIIRRTIPPPPPIPPSALIGTTEHPPPSSLDLVAHLDIFQPHSPPHAMHASLPRAARTPLIHFLGKRSWPTSTSPPRS